MGKPSLRIRCGHPECVYAQRLDGQLGFCAYLLTERTVRGCKANSECNKFRRGRKKKVIDYENNIVKFEIEDIEELEEYDE